MFLNPIMLAAVAGAALPLVLHLLSRARYRNVQWGAMMFLDSADPEQRQSTRLRQSVLLGIRMSTIALLAVALARPVVQGPWARAAAEGRVTAGIIVDCTASMSLREQDRPRLDRAREAAIEILTRLRSGDEAFLLPLGAADQATQAQLHPTMDLQSVASQVVDLQIASGRADLADALVWAAQALSQRGRGSPYLYVITDRQANSWAALEKSFAERWREQQEQRPVRLTVIVVGAEDAENVSVESMELPNPPGVAGQTVPVEVRVRNHGLRARAEAPLTIVADEREIFGTTLSLPAGSAETVTAPLAFDRPGTRRLSAIVEASGIQLDNRLDAVVEIIPPIQVLIVSGDEERGPFQNESDFLALALSPFKSVDRPGDLAVVEVNPAETWDPSDLGRYQVLVLANVPQLSPLQARAVEHFVHGGGGLLVAPGNLSRIDVYNTTLFREGGGILPAALEPATPADGSKATAVLGLDLDHPIFHFLRDRPDPVPPATIGRYFPVARTRSEARVLSRYVTGDPFLIELPAGKGRVLLMTTPIDADWGTLPLTGFYLPFAQSAARHLAMGRLPQKNLGPGQALHLEIDEPVEERATITLPSGQSRNVDLLQLPDRAELQFNHTHEPGLYAVRLRTSAGETRVRWFAVQRSPEESDLTPLTESQWRQLQQEIGFDLVDVQREDLAAALAGPSQRWELWGLLLAAVVALVVAEMAVTRLWSGESGR